MLLVIIWKGLLFKCNLIWYLIKNYGFNQHNEYTILQIHPFFCFSFHHVCTTNNMPVEKLVLCKPSYIEPTSIGAIHHNINE